MPMADGHFHKYGKLIPTFQFRRKLVHDMMYNTIGVDTVDFGRPRRSTYTPAIVNYKLQKVKKYEGNYNKKAKKSKNPNRNIKKSDAPTLKI